MLRLLLVALLVGGAFLAYSRGWFSVSTSRAGQKDEISLSIDLGRIDSDTSAIVLDVGALSLRAKNALRSAGRSTDAGETELVGTVESVDLASRRIMLSSAGRTFDVHVPSDVRVVRNGMDVGFDQLSPTKSVKLLFGDVDADRNLVRVDLQ